MINKTKKVIIFCLGLTLAGIISFPWIVYFIALSNIEGRPTLPTKNIITETEAKTLWTELKETGPVQIQKLTPWHYAVLLITPAKIDNTVPGERVASIVARDYNFKHLKNKRMIYWHLSSAALTVWLTRNWATDQLLIKAQEITAK